MLDEYAIKQRATRIFDTRGKEHFSESLASWPIRALLGVWLWSLGGGLALAAAEARAPEPVTLQLKWVHSFQFAGYYAAEALGYYRAAGLDVRFEEGHPDIDVVERVLGGAAQFGVGTSGLLLARAAGRPVVALAAIFQHSPLVLLALERGDTQSVHDLVGRRVMIEPHSEEIVAYLRREGIPLERLVPVEHSFRLDDLLAGRIDAMTAYVSYEPQRLEALKIRYQTYTPRSAGIDFYSDILFTAEREIREHPARVRAFREASLRGWTDAMANPEAIIELILTRHPAADAAETRAHLRFEADRMKALIQADLMEIGYMNPERWRHIADVYAEVGVLPRLFPLTGFLYQPDNGAELRRLYAILAAVLGGVVAIGGIAVYIHRINRRLARNLGALEQANSRLRILTTAIEQSPTSVVITGLDGCIQYVNPYFTAETGYTAAEAVGQNPRLLQSGLTPAATFRDLWTHLASGRAWTGELINRRKSGEVYWEEARIAPVRDDEGRIAHYVAVKLNVTERRQAYERIAHLAHHDVLTGLPNRTLFCEHLTQGLTLARRNGARLAVLFVDLDRFKPVNDTHGHEIGDLLLQAVAHRLAGCVRASDRAGRIGGDEFVLLLLDVGGQDDALRIADQVREAMGQPFFIAGHRFVIGASIGVAIYPEHGWDDLTLFRHADQAMYRAKAAGGGRARLFDPDDPEHHDKPDDHDPVS